MTSRRKYETPVRNFVSPPAHLDIPSIPSLSLQNCRPPLIRGVPPVLSFSFPFPLPFRTICRSAPRSPAVAAHPSLAATTMPPKKKKAAAAAARKLAADRKEKAAAIAAAALNERPASAAKSPRRPDAGAGTPKKSGTPTANSPSPEPANRASAASDAFPFIACPSTAGTLCFQRCQEVVTRAPAVARLSRELPILSVIRFVHSLSSRTICMPDPLLSQQLFL